MNAINDRYWLLLVVFGVLAGCVMKEGTREREAQNATTSSLGSELPSVFQRALEAHGGRAQWQAQQLLEYDVYRQDQFVDHQLIALQPRKVLLTNDTYRIGYDGADYWISPDTTAFEGDVRFYHNLQFYFMALPFLFADPGIRYEVLESRSFQGKAHEVLRITFESGVGDSSDDEYIVYFDPETHHLTLLLYTVTYFSGEPGEKYNARWYQNWQKVNGLLLPKKVVGYQWTGDGLGEERGTTEYRDAVLSEIPPDESIFLPPTDATVVNR